VLRSALKLTIDRWIAEVWRSVAGVVVMHLMVATLLSRLAPAQNTASKALQLTATVAGGALCYLAIVMLLWLLNGRPDGAETTVLRYLGLRKAAAPGR